MPVVDLPGDCTFYKSWVNLYTQGGGLGVEEGVTGKGLMTQLSGHVTPVM